MNQRATHQGQMRVRGQVVYRADSIPDEGDPGLDLQIVIEIMAETRDGMTNVRDHGIPGTTGEKSTWEMILTGMIDTLKNYSVSNDYIIIKFIK